MSNNSNNGGWLSVLASFQIYWFAIPSQVIKSKILKNVAILKPFRNMAKTNVIGHYILYRDPVITPV